MDAWNTALKRGLAGGAAASLLSTLALAWRGKRDAGSAFAPTNAVSHWIWPEEAFRHPEPSLRHTGTGYLIHHACATFWAVLFERVCGRLLDKRDPALTLGLAGAASAVACVVDYQCTPRRLQPGYEVHLRRPSMVVVYAGLGLGLALGAALCRRS